MIKNFPFKLDIEKEYPNRMYTVNSNDLQTVKFSFVVTDNGIPLDLTGLTVRIAIRKPDKKAVWQDCTITNAPRGEAEVILDNQAYVKKGEHEAEVMLYKGIDTVAITQKFFYRASLGIMSDNSLKSETILGPIDVKLSEVEELVNDLRENGTGIDAQARQDIEEVATQMTEMPKKEEVRLKTQKISQTDVTEEFLQQMAGTTPVNSIPADYSLTNKKFAFPVVEGVKSKNLFDKSAVTPSKYVRYTDGVLMDVSTQSVSDWIPIKPNTTYTKTENTQFAIYDANKNYITGQDGVRTFTTPANASFIRITVRNANIDIVQLEVGSIATEYESFVPKVDPNTIKPKSIEKSMINFEIPSVVSSKNLFDKSSVVLNSYIPYTTGVLTPGSVNFAASDWIPVKPNTTYTKVDNSQFAIYDANKTYISGQETAKTFTTPSNAAYVRLTIRKTNLEVEQLEEGSANTSYEEYGKRIEDAYVPPSINTYLTNNKVTFDIQLPSHIYLVTGESFAIYYNNIIKYSQAFRRGNYYIGHKYVGGNNYTRKGKGYHFKWEYTPNQAEEFQMDFFVIETYTGKKVASKTVTFIARDSALASNKGRTANVVTIGDSFMDLYKVTTFMYDFILNKGGGNNLNMMGTRVIPNVSPPAYDDALAGWTYDWFVNLQTYGANTNPFYNPAKSKFDFSYYMAQKFPAYTPSTSTTGNHLDAFISGLGLNDAIWDTFDKATSKGQVQHIINSVREYDPNIKILLTTVTPQPENDNFLPNSNNWSTGGNYEKSKWNQEKWNEMMLEFHNPSNKIWVLPTASNFDPRNAIISEIQGTDKYAPDFTQKVETDIHPNTTGAKWIADTLFQGIYNLVLR